jgi:hypothetical protein
MFHLGKHADRFGEAGLEVTQSGAEILLLQLDLFLEERLHYETASPCLLESLDAVDGFRQ